MENPLPPTPGYSQYGHAFPSSPARSANGVCTAALWLGFAGLIVPFVGWLSLSVVSDGYGGEGFDGPMTVAMVVTLAGAVAAVLAVVLGSAGTRRAARGSANRGSAIVGLVCGLVGVMVSVLPVMGVFIALSAMVD